MPEWLKIPLRIGCRAITLHLIILLTNMKQLYICWRKEQSVSFILTVKAKVSENFFLQFFKQFWEGIYIFIVLTVPSYDYKLFRIMTIILKSEQNEAYLKAFRSQPCVDDSHNSKSWSCFNFFCVPCVPFKCCHGVQTMYIYVSMLNKLNTTKRDLFSCPESRQSLRIAQ